jgi:CHRD domain-containing protein
MTKFIVWGVALGVGVLAGVSTVVSGDDRGGDSFRLRLEGFQENPSISTPARGRLSLEIQDNDTIEYRLRYSGFEGTTVTASHIHLGARHTNGGVVAFLCGGGDKPVCTTPSGEIEGTIDAADVIGPAGQGIAAGEFAEFVRAIRAGYTYANVHSVRFPTGEIRGQIGDRDDDD